MKRLRWVGVLGFTLLSSISMAQNVPAKSLWLRADIGVNLSGSRVVSWTDQSGNNWNASAPFTSRRPLYQLLGSNFNPTFYFDGSDNLDVSYRSGLNTNNFTVFSVHRLTGGNNKYRSPFTSRDDRPQKGYILYVQPNGTYQFWNGAGNNGGWQVLNTSRFASSSSELLIYRGSRNGNNLVKTGYVNGQSFAGPTSHRFSSNSRRPYRIGAGATEGTGAYFWYGDISEQIIFNSALTTTQRQITESYLAIKYGMSLGNNSQAISYLKADGSTVWDASSTYRFDIAGIAKENSPFDLDQKISSSGNTDLNTSGNVILATTNNFTLSNIDNSRQALSEGQFLLWGHNNQSMNFWVNVGCSQRINRFWRLQNTNNVGTIFLQINLNNFPASSTGTYTLFLDDDTNLSNGVVSTHALVGNGNQYTTSFDPPDGVSYFTIGVRDETLPVISNCPSNIQACSGDVITWTAPTATDNCGTPTLTVNKTSGQIFPDGDTIVTYTATDAFGNTSECSFTVSVNSKPVPVGVFFE
ncbi:HYR domain-containing protein [Ancylomarina euxinus]|nr:HYR domain-containing protein [Ancylomarina euxinus]MCZ4694887.1 HYR domain-containing protein [Ancylomarina euxinus]